MKDIRWSRLNLNADPALELEQDFFNMITLLPVVEHLDQTSLVSLFKECHRMLKPGGMVVLTMPASWAGNLLRGMAKWMVFVTKARAFIKLSLTIPFRMIY
jgi:2-polyprenyl-3-methyl-5-hydroxy-6-metoxy-1,4-benzoquinol methylase